MADWFRRKSWTETDEKEFFIKLARARMDGRAQYLKIQAIELIETKDIKLLEVAEALINKLFADYPDDKFNKPSALDSLGNIYKLRGNYDGAFEYYKQAVDFEIIYPQVKTQAYLSYSEIVVKSKKTNLFPSVEKIILEREPGLLFPIEKYKVYSILAIINKYNHKADRAKHYIELAEKYANSETSVLRYHKYLGIVTERDNWLDRLMKEK
jgi:tetratricopeptide (TPR) repeat protein